MDLPRKPQPELAAYAEWEAGLGEPVIQRAAGRLLTVRGLDAPERMWGLILLTPSRLIFRHFSQPNLMMGGLIGGIFNSRSDEVLWESPRDRFDSCVLRGQKWWIRLFTGVPDHCLLRGPGVELAVETAAPAREFVAAWASSAT
jgi:hypothetical protein